MKPAPFAYHRATSLDDAIEQLNDGEALVRPLAGGQSLIPMLNLRLAPVDKLIDISRIESLKRFEEQKETIRYGALLTHAAFEDRRVPDGSNGLMPFVGSQIAFRAVRTRGTIGGAISLADPAADWLMTIIALQAEVALIGAQGRRVLAANDFVVSAYTTALDQGEVIEAIIVPRRRSSERWGHYKISRKIGEYAESMAIALIDKEAGTARLVVGACDGAPLVLEQAARELTQNSPLERLTAVIGQELAASGRDFSPSKLHLHRMASLRAIENVRRS